MIRVEGMILVPAGNFLMGSKESDIIIAIENMRIECKKYNDMRPEKPLKEKSQNEIPQRLIYLDAFYIDIYPVTNAEYRIFLDKTGYPRRPATIDHPVLGISDHPVVSVSYRDALEYAKWAGKDLPTEAQWEKAARGENGKIYAWGNKQPDDNGIIMANYSPGNNRKICGYEFTCPIDAFPCNISTYGAAGMTGNVFEWTSDWYHDDWYKAGNENVNPQGPSYGIEKVVKGGSYLNLGFCLRCADRHHYDPLLTSEIVGFRCVRNIVKE
ncbi:MAG: formylglycine-generating enzyme family protein [Candidatus Coatesbacteria bacterium]|nr:formylglycine-generating enzyme family protein [Candidatus Coatesbacteria bacterium]